MLVNLIELKFLNKGMLMKFIKFEMVVSFCRAIASNLSALPVIGISVFGMCQSSLEALPFPLSAEQNYNQIKGTRTDEMVNFIKGFPFSNYSIYLAPSQGLFYIDPIQDHIKWILRSGAAWEPHITDLIRQYAVPGTTVLSLGSHIGTHVLTIADAVGPNGRCIAVEPQPKTFRELFMNVSLNGFTNVTFYWAALGEKMGVIELSPFSPRNEAGTGLIHPPKLINGEWSYQVSGGCGSFVDLITVDSMNLDNVSLIQMDTEAMEDAVLDGAKNTILRNKPVIILEIMGSWEYNTAPPEILEQINFTIRKLEGFGYKVSNIVGWDYLAIPQ
jgi:FkbM family methyltransferase